MKWTNPYTQESYEVDEMQNAELIDFDAAMVRLRGPNQAQVFRNHRELRLMGFLKNGIYTHKGSGGSHAA
jgi:hypothetical protein